MRVKFNREEALRANLLRDYEQWYFYNKVDISQEFTAKNLDTFYTEVELVDINGKKIAAIFRRDFLYKVPLNKTLEDFL